MKISLFIASLLLLLISGCTTTKPYRTDYVSPCIYQNTNDCPNSAQTITKTQKGSEYLLSFFEFGDQGYIHNRKEAYKLLDGYKKLANEEDVLLFVFVHGWHHNALGKPEDSNIVEFRNVLSEAADNTNKKVLGVYVGWRGDSVRFPLLDRINLVNFFTFWERKNTAHEIGTQGLTSLLLQIEDTLNHSQNKNHRQITVGHSFGAAALYSAVGPILEERFINRRASKNNIVDGYGDLVVLLNPAFEGIKYASLFELSQQNCETYNSRQKPKLAILSSDADKPNAWAFPTGRRVNVLMETHRIVELTHCLPSGEKTLKINNADTDRYAVGHNRLLLSHDLKAIDDESLSTSEKDRILQEPAVLLSSFDGEVWTNSLQDGAINFGKTILTSRNITQPNSPYLNIWTNKEVMSGHNDIWTDEVKMFLYYMVGLTNN